MSETVTGAGAGGAPAAEAGAFRVLIADSDPLMRETLASIISGIEGFRVVHSTGSLQGAVGFFKRESPDVVIMELDVPWLNGLDAARDMLSADRGAALYTISDYDYFEISQFAQDVDIAGHILKPVAASELSAMFRRHRQLFQAKPSPQLALLSKIVEDRSFGSFYYNLKGFAGSLQEESGRNAADLNSRLSSIHSALLDLSFGGQQASPFPVSQPGLLSIDRVVELCLFQIMNSVFVSKAVKRNGRLQNVFSYLDRNIHQSIGLSHLVSKCFISQGHLSRNFKKCFNISVMEYIHIRKMILSKIFFLFTDSTISDVAERMGYNERSYFSKVFKKFEKLTIQEFKQTSRRSDVLATVAASDGRRFVSEVFGLALN
jgi:two-component system response regulator YesN